MSKPDDPPIICDGYFGSWQRPVTDATDAVQQFADLFDHPAPKRKRRKRTLRDGGSLVSQAREVQR